MFFTSILAVDLPVMTRTQRYIPLHKQWNLVDTDFRPQKALNRKANTPAINIYSRLSLNGHLYKTDTSVKRTPRVGPYLFSSLYLTLYKTDISLRWTASAGPKGVRLRESWLYHSLSDSFVIVHENQYGNHTKKMKTLVNKFISFLQVLCHEYVWIGKTFFCATKWFTNMYVYSNVIW